jgi:hypothetical protein
MPFINVLRTLSMLRTNVVLRLRCLVYLLPVSSCTFAYSPIGQFFQRISRAFKASIIPFHGRFGTLIPYPHPLAVLVGTPIDVEQTDNPTQEQIDELHQRFIEAMTKLFHGHKHEVSGYEQKELFFEDEIVPPPPMDELARYSQFPSRL